MHVFARKPHDPAQGRSPEPGRDFFYALRVAQTGDVTGEVAAAGALSLTAGSSK